MRMKITQLVAIKIWNPAQPPILVEDRWQHGAGDEASGFLLGHGVTASHRAPYHGPRRRRLVQLRR